MTISCTIKTPSELLGSLHADGWLLYDFHGINPTATRVLGIHGMGTRRFFVLLPRSGAPVAIAHRIELASFDGFPGEVRPYAAWTELHENLRALVSGKTLAMEISPGDAVPYLDRVPHGVIQLIEGFGARVVSSGTLVSRFAARWSASELAGHRRAAEALAEIAVETLRWAGAQLAAGKEVRETTAQARVMDAFSRAALVTDHPPIVGFQANAANPHYEPRAGADRALAANDVLLLDLWAGPAVGSVFADQTWMAYAGTAPGAEQQRVWDTVRTARDAAVSLLKNGWSQQQPVTGAALDDAARGVIERRARHRLLLGPPVFQ
jgi:Xaa-Pro aminopeptidase